ncbi:hypothetical protein [Mycolicibacterium baixiangningiae]|uniref:hypothetical protein n=1 Tax=Mycolicibacterium baixiangningiae TaxID=2761578 RepID=UPI0018D0C69B|nr:hypothetical protein [Mycolicibacterium baixiangningiae]
MADEWEGYLTVEEAAEQTGLTPQRVRQLARDGIWRPARWGGALFVLPAISNYT